MTIARAILLLFALCLSATGLTQEKMPPGATGSLWQIRFLIGEWRGEYKTTLDGQKATLPIEMKGEWVNQGTYLRLTVRVTEPDRKEPVECVRYIGWHPEKNYFALAFEDHGLMPREETGSGTKESLMIKGKPWVKSGELYTIETAILNLGPGELLYQTVADLQERKTRVTGSASLKRVKAS